MPEYRKSALALYPLCQRDRDWLLDRLPDVHRQQLMMLLDELTLLGLPRDGFGNELLDQQAAESEAPLPELELTLIDDAESGEIDELMQSEPLSVAATLMGLHAWRWRDELMHRYPMPRRRRIAEVIEANRRHPLPLELRRLALSSFANLLRDRRLSKQRDAEARPSMPVYRSKPGLFGRAWRALWPA